MTAKSSTSTNALDATQKLGEQWVSAVKQGQSLALDVTRAFTGAWASVPSKLPENPLAAALPDVPALAAYSFDLAAELLAAQKEFTVALTTALTPGETAAES